VFEQGYFLWCFRDISRSLSPLAQGRDDDLLRGRLRASRITPAH
jgi:hypothetical protein